MAIFQVPAEKSSRIYGAIFVCFYNDATHGAINGGFFPSTPEMALFACGAVNAPWYLDSQIHNVYFNHICTYNVSVTIIILIRAQTYIHHYFSLSNGQWLVIIIPVVMASTLLPDTMQVSKHDAKRSQDKEGFR